MPPVREKNREGASIDKMKALGKEPPLCDRFYCLYKDRDSCGGHADNSEHYRTALLEVAEELEIIERNFTIPKFCAAELLSIAKQIRKSAGEEK